MHRFFVSPGSLREGELILREAQAHQIRDVLQLRAGETIAVLDNSGDEYRVELTAIGRALVRGRVLEKIASPREPRTQLILYQSLLKADKIEWILQKGTELGITAFVPLSTARTAADAVSRTKRARWERILTEAAEQSGRGKIPALHPVQSLQDALQDASRRAGLALIAWEEERAVDLRTALERDRDATHINLFIGPEGGLSADEIARSRGFGVQPVTLGPRILRAETAGLVAASAIFFARGEMDAHRTAD